MSTRTGLLACVRGLARTFSLRRAKEAGYAAMMVAIIVPVIGLGCAAVAVDIGYWYVQLERVQKAADAAALAGVPYLPQDLPNARARALQVAERNGFDNDAADVTVTAELGDRPTELKVTITTVIQNQFGSMIGVDEQTLSRSATADYQGPAPMGSPCNTFGNEPNAGEGGAGAGHNGTAQGPSAPANCTRTPQFWATVEGPETGKVQGDRYQTKECENSNVDGCTAGRDNEEYDEFGYLFVVKVTDAAVNTPVDVQLYDPMFVSSGQRCENMPSASSFPNDTANTNPYVLNNDARNRYSEDGPTTRNFCTGDSFAGAGSGASPRHPMTTSFVLRQQTDTQNPKVAPVQSDTSGSPCVKQFGSVINAPSANVFKSSSGSYNDEISSQFHNWVSLCTFTPARSGDYYIQVRTNVSLGGSGGTYIRDDNASADDATGNTTSGEGSNAFAIRAVTPSGRENDVAVSGYNHMPIFVNADTASVQFNLIRVLPGAAGQKISFSYFDAGDAAAAGSVQVLPPPDATGSIVTDPYPGDCSAAGGSASSGGETITACTAAFEQSGGVSKNNGKVETITIPIPSDYTCNYAAFSGCWYRVRIGFGTGTVNDVTTWDATVVGDPVRIIK